MENGAGTVDQKVKLQGLHDFKANPYVLKILSNSKLYSRYLLNNQNRTPEIAVCAIRTSVVTQMPAGDK
jgi:hypothetical protein